MSSAELDLSGTIEVTHDAKEFGSAEPEKLSQEALRRITLLRLLASVSWARTPLSLVVRLQGEELLLQFNASGNLARFAAAGSGADLLLRLDRAGKLERGKKQQILKQLGGKTDEGSTVSAIMGQRLVGTGDFWMALRGQVIDSLDRIRAAGGAPFSLCTDEVKRRSGIPFGLLVVPWLDSALRDIPEAELERILGDRWYRYPVLRERPRWPLSALGLDPETLVFLQRSLDGTQTLEQVRKTSHMGRNHTRRLLSTLDALGLLEILNRPRGAQGELSLTAELEQELERRQSLSLFEQMGAHWSDHPATYTSALEKVRSEYGPESQTARLHPEARPLCEKIVRLAEAAAARLRDERSRRSLRQELLTPFQMEAAASHLGKQAELLLLRQEVLRARQALEVAVELDPKNEYRRMLEQIRRIEY